ncbi:hypothetical protein OKW48_008203 [Paraburkholderia youngii]
MLIACCAACPLDTRPASTRLPAALDTRMPRSFGSSCASVRCSPSASTPTLTSMI